MAKIADYIALSEQLTAAGFGTAIHNNGKEVFLVAVNKPWSFKVFSDGTVQLASNSDIHERVPWDALDIIRLHGRGQGNG